MSKAFHVPADLADIDMTLAEVRAIIENRRKVSALEGRLARLPAKEKQLREAIQVMKDDEDRLLKNIQLRNEARDRKRKQAAQATGQPTRESEDGSS